MRNRINRIRRVLAEALNPGVSMQGFRAGTEDAPRVARDGTGDEEAAHIPSPASPNTDGTDDANANGRILDLRQKQVEFQQVSLDRWLTVVRLALGLLAVSVAVLGIFINIKVGSIDKKVDKLKARADQVLEQIEKDWREIQNNLRQVTAETVALDPREVIQTAAFALQNPRASPTDHLIADAVLQQVTGTTADAIEKWRVVARRADEDDTALSARAWSSVGFLQMDQPTEAIGAFRRSIELNPRDPHLYVLQGKTQAELGNLPDALKNFDKAVELDPDSVEARVVRGLANFKRGEIQDGLEDYRKLMDGLVTLDVSESDEFKQMRQLAQRGMQSGGAQSLAGPG